MGVTTDHGDKQRLSVMMFLRAYKRDYNYMPTISEIARELGMQRNAVVWHLSTLRDEGRVAYRDGHLSRSLRVVK